MIGERLKVIAIIIVFAIIAAILIGFTVLEIYTWTNYWNKPIEEIPAWALWLMFKD